MSEPTPSGSTSFDLRAVPKFDGTDYDWYKKRLQLFRKRNEGKVQPNEWAAIVIENIHGEPVNLLKHLTADQLFASDGLDTIINILDAKYTKDSFDTAVDAMRCFLDCSRNASESFEDYISRFHLICEKLVASKFTLDNRMKCTHLLLRSNLNSTQLSSVYGNLNTLEQNGKDIWNPEVVLSCIRRVLATTTISLSQASPNASDPSVFYSSAKSKGKNRGKWHNRDTSYPSTSTYHDSDQYSGFYGSYMYGSKGKGKGKRGSSKSNYRYRSKSRGFYRSKSPSHTSRRSNAKLAFPEDTSMSNTSFIGVNFPSTCLNVGDQMDHELFYTSGIIDTGCVQPICSEKFVRGYIKYLRSHGYDESIELVPSDKHFYFADGKFKKCQFSVILPVWFNSRKRKILVYVFKHSNIGLLLHLGFLTGSESTIHFTESGDCRMVVDSERLHIALPRDRLNNLVYPLYDQSLYAVSGIPAHTTIEDEPIPDFSVPETDHDNLANIDGFSFAVKPGVIQTHSLPDHVLRKLETPEEVLKNHLKFHHISPEKLFIRYRQAGCDPSVRKTIDDVISKCDICIATKKPNLRNITGGIISTETNQVASMDLCFVGDTNLIVCHLQDAHSGFSVAKVISSKQAKNVLSVLFLWHRTFGGPPLILHSDCGGEFINQLLYQYCSRFDVKFTTSLPYTPEQNSLIERRHAVLKNSYVKILLQHFRDYGTEFDSQSVLDECLFAINTTPGQSGFSPFNIAFGRFACVGLNLYDGKPTQTTKKESYHKELSDQLTLIENIRQSVTAYLSSSKLQDALRHRIRTNDTVFSPGDSVLLYKRVGVNKPVELCGPYEVLAYKGANKWLLEKGNSIIKADAKAMTRGGYSKNPLELPVTYTADDGTHTVRSSTHIDSQSHAEASPSSSTSIHVPTASKNPIFRGSEPSHSILHPSESASTNSEQQNIFAPANPNKRFRFSMPRSRTRTRFSPPEIRYYDPEANDVYMDVPSNDVEMRDPSYAQKRTHSSVAPRLSSDSIESVTSPERKRIIVPVQPNTPEKPESPSIPSTTIALEPSSTLPTQAIEPPRFSENRAEFTPDRVSEPNQVSEPRQSSLGNESNTDNSSLDYSMELTVCPNCGIEIENCDEMIRTHLELFCKNRSTSVSMVNEVMPIKLTEIDTSSQTDKGMRSVTSQDLKVYKYEFDTAKKKELDSWAETGSYTLEKYDPSIHDHANKVSSRWICTWKKTDVQNVVVPKARLVLRGFEDLDNSLRTDAPTLSSLCFRLICLWSVQHSFAIKSLDIRTAYLQGNHYSDDRVVYAIPPSDVHELIGTDSDIILRAHRAIYGLRDAPRQWHNTLKEFFLTLGLKQCDSDKSVFIYMPHSTVEGIIGIHVDDLLFCGNSQFHDTVIQRLLARFKCGKVFADEFSYTGVDLKTLSNGTIFLSQSKYAASIQPMPIPSGKPTDPISPSVTTDFRKLVGNLAWISQRSRPDLAYAVNHLATIQSSATVDDVKLINKVQRRALTDKDVGIYLNKHGPHAFFLLYTDASLGKEAKHNSQGGMLLFMASYCTYRRVYSLSLLDWFSRKLYRKVRSSESAETLALADSIEHYAHHAQSIWKLFHNSDFFLPIVAMCDNKSVVYLGKNDNNGIRNKNLLLDLSVIRQSYEHGRVKDIVYVPTSEQLADALTKNTSPRPLENLCTVLRKCTLKLSL